MFSALFPFTPYFFAASSVLYLLGAAFSLAFRGDAGRRLSFGSCAAGAFADMRPQALIYGLLTALGRLEGKR